MAWITMQDRNYQTMSWGSTKTFKVTPPPSTDNKVTLKFVDLYGDGWESGTLTLFQDINNQKTEGLLPISNAWVRQDTYNPASSGQEQGQWGSQESNTRTCHSRWLLRAKTGKLSHKECRDQCRTEGKDCTHYSWYVSGDSHTQSYRMFQISPAVLAQKGTSEGVCKLYNVDYTLMIIGQDDWNMAQTETVSLFFPLWL
jgi:hypothetical protein